MRDGGGNLSGQCRLASQDYAPAEGIYFFVTIGEGGTWVGMAGGVEAGERHCQHGGGVTRPPRAPSRGSSPSCRHPDRDPSSRGRVNAIHLNPKVATCQRGDHRSSPSPMHPVFHQTLPLPPYNAVTHRHLAYFLQLRCRGPPSSIARPPSYLPPSWHPHIL